MLGDLARNGFQVTEDLQDSDAVIVNTCAFVEGAKTESLEVGFSAEGRLCMLVLCVCGMAVTQCCASSIRHHACAGHS